MTTALTEGREVAKEGKTAIWEDCLMTVITKVVVVVVVVGPGYD